MARIITHYENRQRGCVECLHVTSMKQNGLIRTACPFNECPFTVLDKYKSYVDFMASDDSKINVPEFFTSSGR